MRGKTNRSRIFSNPNLLDNPWFTINQREKNSYGNNTNPEMSMDRWRCDAFVKASYSNGKWTIRNDDSTNIRAFTQTTELDLLGKTVTYSVLVDGKITSVTFEVPITKPTEYTALAYKSITDYNCYLVCWHYPNGQLVLHINLNPSASIIPEAVKLELGTESTLHLDVPPNYAEELAKCQRYFEVGIIWKGANNRTDGYAVEDSIDFKVTKRAEPTITFINFNNGEVGSIWDTGQDKSYKATCYQKSVDGFVPYFTETGFGASDQFIIKYQASSDL